MSIAILHKSVEWEGCQREFRQWVLKNKTGLSLGVVEKRLEILNAFDPFGISLSLN